MKESDIHEFVDIAVFLRQEYNKYKLKFTDKGEKSKYWNGLVHTLFGKYGGRFGYQNEKIFKGDLSKVKWRLSKKDEELKKVLLVNPKPKISHAWAKRKSGSDKAEQLSLVFN